MLGRFEKLSMAAQTLSGSVILVAALLIGIGSATSSSTSDGTRTITILFQGSEIRSSPTRVRGYRVLAPIVRSGKLLVPLRDLMMQLGATDIRARDQNTIEFRRNGHRVTLSVGSRQLRVDNGIAGQPLDVAPQVDHGRIFIPLRALTQALGATVSWDPPNIVRIVAPFGASMSPQPATSGPTTNPASPNAVCCAASCPPKACGELLPAPSLLSMAASPGAWLLVAALLAGLAWLLRSSRDRWRRVPWTRAIQVLIAALGIIGAAFHAFPALRKADEPFPVFDTTTAAWLLAIVIAYYLPSLSEFSFGGFKAVIRKASEKPVGDDTLRYRPVAVGEKSDLAHLEARAAERPVALSLVAGRRYDDMMIREYLRRLRQTLRWIVFEESDHTFSGLAPALIVEMWVSSRMAPNESFANLVAERRHSEVPGFFDRSVFLFDTRRTALRRFRMFDVSTLAVLDADERFVGTVDRSQVLEDLLAQYLTAVDEAETPRPNRTRESDADTGPVNA